MQQKVSTVPILRIPIYAKNIEQATQEVIDTCLSQPKANGTISATGAHGSVFAQSNPEFFRVLSSFTMNLPDGQPLVWVGRLKKAAEMERCYGPDFFESVLTHSADRPINHFFCGGREGVAEKLKQEVATQFGNHNISGTYCPPFLPVDQYDYAEIARQINASNANIVWIGLSTPKQEMFASYLRSFTRVHYIITVGAAFDFHTGSITKAPKLVAKAGMEWFFRLVQEPRRLFKRYARIVPLFIYYNLKELTSPK